MDFDSNQHSLHSLITLLESLFASTHQSKLSIEAHSREAQKLLFGWVLPEDERTSDACRCAESQKQQLVAFLDKVGKAVKYSQSVREGRCDVSSPWPDDKPNTACKEEARKSNSKKELPASKLGLGLNRDKLIRGNMTNGSKKTSSNSSGVHFKSSSCLPEKQEQHVLLCPVHGGSPKSKSSPTVGLAEALDVKGIPPELVTVLKSVHQFINRLRASNGNKNRTESSFLRYLNAVNETKRSKITSFNGVLKDLPCHISGEHYGKIPIFEEENSSSKIAVSQTDNNNSFVGVWNPTICNTLSVGAFCIQYQNEVIWNLLQMRIQQLQVAQAEWEVCNILSCNPLLCNPDLHFSAAPLFLKAASALSRITTLNLPVLVKTCHES